MCVYFGMLDNCMEKYQSDELERERERERERAADAHSAISFSAAVLFLESGEYFLFLPSSDNLLSDVVYGFSC